MDTTQIRAILGDAVTCEIGLLDRSDPCGHGARLEWWPNNEHVDMHGWFTADELEAIAAHMRAHGAK